ncbi:hypothetical protein SAMN05421505_12928 [Sinosporangium album]|uniref:Uncharacterized protein n=1 Tax=Sinosporangium album TaxID=504805 RepID=A0A1G8GUX7_9ACTN|nr:hypothetical protein SAMN05421505_12928 [Sinosporangium album]
MSEGASFLGTYAAFRTMGGYRGKRYSVISGFFVTG